MMALLTLGLMRFEEVTSYGFLFDPTQNKGKLWRMLEKSPGLLRDGTDLRDLHKYLRNSYGNELASSEVTGSSEEVIGFAIDHLRQHKPVIVGVRYAAGGHWLVVIGYEEDAQGNVIKLLALDSSGAAAPFCVWNAFLDIEHHAKGKQYRYTWANAIGPVLVKLEDALAIGRA
jgi:hypothetical protein